MGRRAGDQTLSPGGIDELCVPDQKPALHYSLAKNALIDNLINTINAASATANNV